LVLTRSKGRQIGYEEKVKKQLYGVGFMALMEDHLITLGRAFHWIINPWHDMMFASAFGARHARCAWFTAKESEKTHRDEYSAERALEQLCGRIGRQK
jgi:hypothetical protein